jgi:hypothetical protein
MSNQDLRNYLGNVLTKNNDDISSFTMQIENFQTMIDGNIQSNIQFQTQIDNLNSQINKITGDNELIPVILSFIPE